ncbi:MAG: PDZ domain-containing protein [Brooklawnia sp.]|nr:PDZ domain-containing protein [Brooklawnia sp.]
MSNEPNIPNPWSREAKSVWDAEAPAQATPGAASTQYPTAPAQATPGAASTQYPSAGTQYPSAGTQYPTPPGSHLTTTPRPTRAGGGKIAGLLLVALLAGAAGGGAAGYTVSQLGSPAPVTQTEVVQADPSNPDWTTVADSATRAVVAIQVVGSDGTGGQGSGVVIDAAGHIVTNNHVVASSSARSSISVVLGNVAYPATIVGTDPTTDLAVIKLNELPPDLEVMGFADLSSVQVGDPVMAIGNPLGLNDTVTTGIVSALNRPVTTRAISDTTSTQQGDLVVTAAIQTNAAINPGNSGGALVNTSGQLVGITSSIASLSSSSDSQSGNIGLGFAIGADQVQYVAEQLISQGYADHPQVGLSATDVSGSGQLGARVVRITQGSPAEQSGVQVGDLITAVDGVPVPSTESLVALVRAGRVGEPIELTLIRGGQTQTVTVTPVAAPR